MILISPDKFKGTFTATEICDLIIKRLRENNINESIRAIPLSDGGEGAAETFLPGALKISKGVYEKDGEQIVVSSEIVGLDSFKGSNIPLMNRSSFMLGKVIKPGKKTFVAIGGTAVSDCGAGFLQGLGAQFFDKNGSLINLPITPATLKEVASADLTPLKDYNITAIIDVRAHLFDGQLSAIDFAPQKAFPGENLSELPDALRHFQSILGGKSEFDGAGGGLGYAIASVMKSPCISGAQAAVSRIDWEGVDLVITGEGCVDRQTFEGGKLVDVVTREANKRNIPTLILCGKKEGLLPYKHLRCLNSQWHETVISILQQRDKIR